MLATEECYPGSFSKISVTLVTFTNKFYQYGKKC